MLQRAPRHAAVGALVDDARELLAAGSQTRNVTGDAIHGDRASVSFHEALRDEEAES
jgi:hypothetical protein